MRWWSVVLVVVVACAAFPALARAGSYDVLSCRSADGVAAATGGWTAFRSPPASSFGVLEDSCSDAGALSAAMGAELLPAYAELGWVFTAPADTVVSAFAVQRQAL